MSAKTTEVEVSEVLPTPEKEGPPPSGDGGAYPTQEISSGDQRLTGLGPTGYDLNIVTSTVAPGYGGNS